MAGNSKSAQRCGAVLVTTALLQGGIFAPAQASYSAGFHALMASSATLPDNDDFNLAAPILAESLIEDVGGGQRINNSGRLRMLSQRITAAACNLAAGVASEQSKDAMVSAQLEFSNILVALTNGNDSLGIFGPETDRQTLAQIESTTAIWAEFDTALNGVLSGSDVDAQIAYISENSDALLQAAIVLTSEISGEYSNPAEMTQSMALTLDIAGRQRMLTQMMAKQLCGVVNDNPALGDTEQLGATIAMYETTLAALHDGMPEAGIAPPATPEIKSALEQATADWVDIKLDLIRATGPGTLSPDDQGDLFNRLTNNMLMMNEITRMYTAMASATL